MAENPSSPSRAKAVEWPCWRSSRSRSTWKAFEPLMTSTCPTTGKGKPAPQAAHGNVQAAGAKARPPRSKPGDPVKPPCVAGSVFAPGPGTWRDGWLVQFFRRHSTGLTIASVAAIAVALSALPLPDWAKPFPELLQDPRETAMVALLRRSERPPEATPGLPQTGGGAEDADTAGAAATPIEPMPVPTGPLEPSAED